MRLLASCCVGRTDLMLDVAPLRLRSNRLAALPKTNIRTARARIRWRILGSCHDDDRALATGGVTSVSLVCSSRVFYSTNVAETRLVMIDRAHS